MYFSFTKLSLKVVVSFCLLFSLQSYVSMKPAATKVIAHRGAWKNTGVPQNSLAALQHAIRLGCYGSEFDVHMSADSGLYVSHDYVIQNVPIEKSTASQLAAVKLPNGESIPTLEAYLNAGKEQKKTRLILEIKPSQLGKAHSLALAQKCVETVRQTGTRRLVDYISFDYDVCKKVLALDPKASVAYLNGDKTPAEIKADGLDGMDYNQNVYKRNEDWISEAKQHKRSLNVWTVNDKAQMQWFMERGFDFITTDEPEVLLELVRK
jgi:glycerophosphoryl diester phosphodiesterase